MRKYGAILGGAVILSTIVVSVGAWGVSQAGGAGDGGAMRLSAGSMDTVLSARAYQGSNGGIVAAANSGRSVYFFPQDGSTTATILSLVNVSTQTAYVDLTAYLADGTVKTYSVTLPSSDVEHVCTDLVSGQQTGWHLTDFGVGVFLAELWLPAGVLVDGFVAWNGASDVYDPGASVERLPLRFLETSAP